MTEIFDYVSEALFGKHYLRADDNNAQNFANKMLQIFKKVYHFYIFVPGLTSIYRY